MFHNLVRSFKQPKLTRTLLAKWRALAADKRPTLNSANASESKESTRDKLWATHSSDDDEDGCDDAVAVIEIVRDHFGASDKNMSRSDQLRHKEYDFLDMKTRELRQLTRVLTLDSTGEEGKCSTSAVDLSKQPYKTMTLQEASSKFSKLRKGISLDEVVENDEFDEEDVDLPEISNNNIDVAQEANYVDATEITVNEFEDTGLPKGYKLTGSQKVCVSEMRKEMEKGQMLVFIHGPPGSGKTTTARLLVSEKNLNLVFSGTTGTASSLYKSETINCLLHLGKNVEDFQPSGQRISAHIKTEILSKFGDARILIIDEVSMLSPVMLALIDLRLRQCFDAEKPCGGLHIIIMGDMFQFPPVGRKLRKPALFQAAVLCSRNRRLPNKSYRDGANLFMKFRLLNLKGQERVDKDFDLFLKPLRDTRRKKPITRSWVKKLRKLTPMDIREDNSWAFTTIAVTGNNERLAITRAQVERFGWMRHEPVLHWVCPVRTRKKGCPVRSEKSKRKTKYTYANLEVDPSLLKGVYSNLRCFFVRGAPCVLSENLCTTLGYAKGTRGTFESVVWDPSDGEVPDIKSLQPGVITNVMQPRFIIIRVKGKLIPIGTCNGKIRRYTKQKIRFTNFRKHPVDLLFAVTYHKLQGLTLDKLILSINKHPNWRLRLVLSSLYVGLSRVHKLDDIRVLDYCDEDVDYLITLKLDDLLKAWLNNYTEEGRWRYDGFKTFERKMLEKTNLDLGLVDDLALLIIDECKDYLSKLDIISTGTKVTDLHSALRKSYAHGRDLLTANNGALLIRHRISLYKQLKKLGDYKKLTLARLRYFGKRLGISNCVKMRKHIIISALNEFETTHSAEIFNSSNTHRAYVRPLFNHLRQNNGVNASRKPVDAGPVQSKLRTVNLSYVGHDSQPQMLQRRYKGLHNPNNRCYFNSVMQCLLYCPPVMQEIENLPQHAQSIVVLREIRLLFKSMTNNDGST